MQWVNNTGFAELKTEHDRCGSETKFYICDISFLLLLINDQENDWKITIGHTGRAALVDDRVGDRDGCTQQQLNPEPRQKHKCKNTAAR